MRVLSNPMVSRMAFAVFVLGFACVAGIVLVRRLRRMFTQADSLEDARPEPEQFPMHAYNSVIQQLKQQKHELVTAQQAERRRAKTSENISAAVLSRLPSGVMFFATNGLVRQANTAARQILGFASLAGMSVAEIFRDAALAPAAGLPTRLTDAIQTALRGQAPPRGLQAHYIAPGGEHRILEITMAPVFAPAGDILGAACLINDTTRMAEIQQQQELRGEMSAEMALALRTSVATISGYARRLANGRDPEQTRRLAEDIILEAAQLDQTIGGFLAGTRTETNATEA
ncbi:MAG TPA: PAS domain-containing protein [Terriglobales bacterium]|nr:PAS domain-containing protein [Terriglobales bacterium]